MSLLARDGFVSDSGSSIITLHNPNPITGLHLVPTCQENPDNFKEPLPKQPKDSLDLRLDLNSSSFVEQFISCWNDNSAFSTNDVEFLVEPFRTCVVRNLLENDSIICDILDEFNELEWHKRSLDLYEFFQSSDLKHISSKYINIMYEFLKNDVMSWVEKLTGLELTSISATCSLYGDTDYLLVHDDQQDDRVVAFVLYLMRPRPWSAENGGALQLLSKDDDGQPFQVVRDILPQNNQFVFFKVTDDSYHQVSEVMNKNDCRMSINGWFHHKPQVFKAPLYKTPTSGLFGASISIPQQFNVSLHTWISQIYLDRDAASHIQKHMEKMSEIALHNYFKKEAIDAVVEQLQLSDIRWKQVGPPNRYLYEVVEYKTIPDLAQQFLKLYRSPEMLTLLHQYTDLNLKSMRYELQRWKPGCYSLLTDYEWSTYHELDLVMFLGCPNTQPVVGGSVVYMATEEQVEDALVTIRPAENCLNIVFRDSARITKYVSKYTTCPFYYLLICSYSE